MKRLIKIFSILLFFCVSVNTYATVGGPQTIEVLGYDSKDQKIYVMRHFEDGRGRLPQLYYYQLNSKKPAQLITVKSLYINPVTKRIDYDQDSTQFDQTIAKIKKRLIKLTPIHNSNVSIQMLTTMNGTAAAWYDPQESIDKWTYQYIVKSPLYKSSIQTAVTYKEGLKISKTYKVPKQPYILVTVRYLGIPFESGYSVEDPVLLGK
jgi:hypothetical protein